MPSDIVVPVHVLFDVLLCIKVARKSKAIHELALLDRMKRFGVGIFFRRSSMGELLHGFECLQYLVGDELRTV